MSDINVDNGFRQTESDGKNNKPRVGAFNADELVGVVKKTLNAVDTAGGVFSFQNDSGSDLIVDISFINVTTASTGACTVDIGVAANATTSDDTIIDGLDVNAATGVFNSIDDAGTNGGIGVLLPAGRYITASVATGASAGIVGSALIKYARA